MNRRNFLKLFGVASVASIAISDNVFASHIAKKSCVIIGAGLSGLSAAYKLKKAGWQITVLEARTRIGGRVFSQSFAENPKLVYENGGEWVGASHERVQSLCREFEIPLQDHRFRASLLRNGEFSRPSEWRFSAQSEMALKKLFAGMKNYTVAQNAKLDRLDWWTLLQKIGFTDDDLRLRDLMDSTDFGESIRDVSAFAAASEYAESSAENEMDFKMSGGNSRLPFELAKRIGANSIRLNTLVDSISQRAGIVTIKTANGETFISDACICTVPTASLRKIKFEPNLPEAQTDAAEKLIYARICKNAVLFDERFWKDENFSLVTDLTSHYYFHATQNQPDKQGILTSYAVGEKADILASQNDSRRLKIVTSDLIDYDRNAPNLARGIASYAWQRDQYTQGSYALYRPSQWFGVRPILQRPHFKVLFAGEHLADWQGFMEGAIETGETAANNLIKS